MSLDQRMLKDKQSLFMEEMVEPTRDGRFSISTKKVRRKLRDLIPTSDSTEIDHSISDPDFQ